MALKRSPGPESADIGAVRLWLDDIERLVAELSEDGTYTTKITADGFIAESVDDLASLPQRTIKELRLTQHGAHRMIRGSIDISRSAFSGCTIRVETADDAGLGALERLKAALKRHRRLIGGRLDPYAATAAIALLGAVVAFVGVLSALIQPAEFGGVSYGVLATAALAGAMWPSIAFTAWFGRSLIYTARKAERPSWWQRNQDHLTVGLITGMGGAVIGAVLTYYLTRP